jgi:adenine-specific DNA-methyltransferase
MSRRLPPRDISFDLSGHSIAALEPFVGSEGWLRVSRLRVETFDAEEFLVLAAVAERGECPDPEALDRMLGLPATLGREARDQEPLARLAEQEESRKAEILRGVEQRNTKLFDDEAAKLDAWADDMKFGLERELRELDAEIVAARRTMSAGVTLAEKVQAQRCVKALEQTRTEKRRRLFEAQDRIDAQRTALIDGIERQLTAKATWDALFLVRWRLK